MVHFCDPINRITTKCAQRHIRISYKMVGCKFYLFVWIVAVSILKAHAFFRFRFNSEPVEEESIDSSPAQRHEFQAIRYPGDTKESGAKTTGWGNVSLKLDHFNPQDPRRFTMRYATNNRFFKEGGPIFIFLGGEWNISDDDLTTGQMYDMAKAHDGYMFYSEHRFYGFSRPTRDMSVKNLRYLNVDQAMADVVYFIRHIKETIEGLQHSKVVLVGCSYAAALATWLRQRYPHAIDIVYSSGATLKSVVDFTDYFQVMGEVLASVSQKCYDIIKTGISQLQTKLETPSGRSQLSKVFSLCSEIKDGDTYKSSFFHTVATTTFAGDFQTGGIPAMRRVCKGLERDFGSPLKRIATYVSQFYNATKCLDDYDAILKKNRVTTFPNEDRAWTYQSCTEIGYGQTTASDTQPWGDTVRIEYLTNYCRDLFGKGFGADMVEEGVERINTFNGGLEPELTKIVSVHSTMDGWSKVGLSKDLGPLAPVLITQNSKHCADLHSLDVKRDSEELIEVKIKAQRYIAEWLKD